MNPTFLNGGAVNMSKQTIFTGSGVAIVTPMKADGSVNYEKVPGTHRVADRKRHRCDHRLRHHRRVFHPHP